MNPSDQDPHCFLSLLAIMFYKQSSVIRHFVIVGTRVKASFLFSRSSFHIDD